MGKKESKKQTLGILKRRGFIPGRLQRRRSAEMPSLRGAELLLSDLEADSNSQSDRCGTTESESFRAEWAVSRIAELSKCDGGLTRKKWSAHALVMIEGSVVKAPLTVSSEGIGMGFDFPVKEPWTCHRAKPEHESQPTLCIWLAAGLADSWTWYGGAKSHH